MIRHHDYQAANTPMAEVAASMAQLLADEPMATAAVFEPTPLDMLDIARLRHLHPEYADRLADAAGRQFDRETSRSAR